MKNTMLQKIEKILESSGYMIMKSDETEASSLQYLSVLLPPDEKDRSRYLTVKTEEQSLSTPLESENKHTETFVQLLSVLPFKISEGSAWEVLRATNFFNSALPTPGFILDEGAGQVFFRYTFLKPDEELQQATILSLIGMILLWIDSASPTIEETGSGKPMVDVIRGRIEALQSS